MIDHKSLKLPLVIKLGAGQYTIEDAVGVCLSCIYWSADEATHQKIKRFTKSEARAIAHETARALSAAAA